MRALLKLLALIAACEAAVMALFIALGWDNPEHAVLGTWLDPVLLTLLIAWPLYRVIVLPLRRDMDVLNDHVRVLAAALDQLDEGVMVTDRAGQIEYANRALCDMYQRRADEVVGRRASEFEPRMASREWRRAFLGALHRGRVWREELREQPAGRDMVVEYLTMPVRRCGKVTHFVTLKRDVSERHEMEWQLRQAQKMEVVGALSGGIAHNFNNMLAAISGNAYLLRSMLDGKWDANRAREKLRDIERIVEDAAGHVRSLLAFARKGMLDVKDVPVAPIIEETIRLASVRVPENLRLSVEVSADDAHVRTDATQLQQAVLNLVNNAVDALEGRETGGIAVCVDRMGGGMICIAVSDDGPGMPAEVAARACDPYFTTKPVGKGTGLGLAMAQGFAAHSGGRLEVDSAPGKGTEVRICLPEVVALDARPAEHAPPPTGRAAAANWCVLLADDDDDVRGSHAEALRAGGFRVLAARDGRDALRLFLAHGREIHGALLDVIMPEMGGVKLARRLREVRPTLPVVLMTGYDSGEEAEAARKSGVCDMVIAKPVAPDRLHALLAELMAQ